MIQGVQGSVKVHAATTHPAPTPIAMPQPRRGDVATLSSSSVLRSRLSVVDGATRHLQSVGLFVDAADTALARTEDLIIAGRDRIASGAGGVDDILTSIDRAVSSPRLGDESALSVGVTVRAGGGAFDVPPVSTADLGAVIDAGRSHRLADARAGGTLDPGANKVGAMRSFDAAAQEVRAVRLGLTAFRSESLEPAQRAALGSLRDMMATGPVGPRDAEALAMRVRAGLSNGGALSGADATNVLALLA